MTLPPAERDTAPAQSDLFLDALDNMSEGIVVYDAHDRLVFCNQMFRSFYDYAEEDVQPGVTFAELGALDTKRGVVDVAGNRSAYLESRFEHRRSLEGSIDVQLADGRWLQVRDRRTATGGIVSVQADITRLKALEAEITAAKREADAEVLRQRDEIAKSEQRYRAIIEDQTEMISRLDPDLNLTFTNQAYRRTYLSDPDNEKIIGKCILDLIADPELRALYRENLNRLTPEAPIARSELLEHVADGTLQWQSWTDRALFDDDGQLTGYQSVGRDITSRKIAEQALAANYRERQAIIDGAPDAIITFDMRGEIREYNLAAEETLGWDRQSALGAQIGTIIVPQENRTTDDTSLADYMAEVGGDNVLGRRLELDLLRRDGERFPAEITVVRAENRISQDHAQHVEIVTIGPGGEQSPQRFNIASPIQGAEETLLVAFIRDLTEKHRLEAQMAKQREALAQSEKLGALGSLLANVAHELNNPLAVVIGQADLLASVTSDPKLKDRADRIKRAAKRCAGIVGTFLAAVRQKAPDRMLFDPMSPVRESVELLDYALKTSGIELDIEARGELPHIYGDETQIGQVLSNLLVNAQQALGGLSGDRKVSVRITSDAGTNMLNYAIADSGSGVPDDKTGKIFEPFFTTKPEGSGTGIGLAIVSNIAKAHGGSITCGRDDVLGGAVFNLSLPVPSQAEVESSRRTAVTGSGWTKEGRILVVDDEKDVADTAADYLIVAGFDCETASDGEAALKLMETHGFDGVISDLRMPGMDGPTLYRVATGRWPATSQKFGFFTGDNLSADAGQFIKSVGAPAIDKPFTSEDLVGLARLIITERKRSA